MKLTENIQRLSIYIQLYFWKSLAFLKDKYIIFMHKRDFKAQKKIADELYELTGKRHYVVPTDGSKMMVINNETLKKYNQISKRRGSKQIDHLTVSKIAYYMTSPGSLTRKK